MRTFLAIILALLMGHAQADKIPRPQVDGRVVNMFGPYNAKVIRVLDGDTVEMEMSVFPFTYHRLKVRVFGIDTPEVRTTRLCEKKMGLFVKRFVESELRDATQIYVTGITEDAIPGFGKAKYAGRVIGTILYTHDKPSNGSTRYPQYNNFESISAILLKNNMARAYIGGTRQVGGWCTD